jgi:hypothetical protein
MDARYRDYYLALFEVTRAVNSTLNFKEVMSRRLLDEEKRSLRIRASYGLSDRYLAKGPVEVVDPWGRRGVAGPSW